MAPPVPLLQLAPAANAPLLFVPAPLPPSAPAPFTAKPLPAPFTAKPLTPPAIPPLELREFPPGEAPTPEGFLPGFEFPVPPAAPALPAVVDTATDIFDPDDPDWAPAPWNIPDTPASLVPPTEAPTGEYPAPPTPGGGPDSYTITFTFPTREWQIVDGERQVINTYVDFSTFSTFATPLGIRTEKDLAAGRIRTKFLHSRILPSGDEFESQSTAKFALADNPEGLGDLYDSVNISYEFSGDPDPVESPERLVPLFPPPSVILVAPPPAPELAAPATPLAPIPENLAPAPQPEAPPIPQESPIPLIPLPVPLPPQNPEIQDAAPPLREPPATPAPPITPDYPPTPGPGADPQTETPRKLPPVPFDFCSLDCIDTAPCEPVLLLKRRSAIPSFNQVLDFSSSLLGQFCSNLPSGIASIAIDVTAVATDVKVFTAADNGDRIGQFGTVSLVVDGRPIQDYSLSRFERTVIEVPYSPDLTYQVLVAPLFGSTVQVSDLGDRWGVYRVSGSDLLPIISASVLT